MVWFIWLLSCSKDCYDSDNSDNNNNNNNSNNNNNNNNDDNNNDDDNNNNNLDVYTTNNRTSYQSGSMIWYDDIVSVSVMLKSC